MRSSLAAGSMVRRQTALLRKMIDDDPQVQCTSQWCSVMRKLSEDRAHVDMFVGYRELCRDPASVIRRILFAVCGEETAWNINVPALQCYDAEFQTGAGLRSRNEAEGLDSADQSRSSCHRFRLPKSREFPLGAPQSRINSKSCDLMTAMIAVDELQVGLCLPGGAVPVGWSQRYPHFLLLRSDPRVDPGSGVQISKLAGCLT